MALNLCLLTRQPRALTESYMEIKLQFQVAMDEIFLGYYYVFNILYSKLLIKSLSYYLTALGIWK